MLSTRHESDPNNTEQAFSALISLVSEPGAYVNVRKHYQQVKHYFEDEALLNMSDEVGDTPLHYAVCNSTPSMVNFLLQKGAKVDLLNHFEQTPFLAAMHCFNLEEFSTQLHWIKLFIQEGSNVALRDVYGKAPLEYAMHALMAVVKTMPFFKVEQWASNIIFEPLIRLALITPRSIIDYSAFFDDSTEEDRDSLFYQFRDFVFEVSQYDLYQSSVAFKKVISSLVQAINPVCWLDIHKIIQEGLLLSVMRYVQDDPIESRAERDDHGNDLLMFAVSEWHLRKVYCKDSEEKTMAPLPPDVLKRQLDIVKYLVSQQWPLNVFNGASQNALMIAVYNDNLDVLNCLLSRATQAELCAFQDEEITLASTAASVGHDKAFGHIAEALTRKSSSNSSEFLHLLDKKTHKEIANYINLKLCIGLQEVRAEDRSHRVAIGRELFLGRMTDMKSGVFAHQFIYDRDANGKTALHYLVAPSRYRIIRNQFPGRLFANKTEPMNDGQLEEEQYARFLTMRPISGEFAHATKHYFWLINGLITLGLSVNATDFQGNTVLMACAKTPNYIIAFDLIQRGAVVDAVNHAGETALMIAARAGHIGMVRLLVQQGADPDKKNNKGKTALELSKNKAIAMFIRMLKSTQEKTYHTRDAGSESSSKRMKR